MTVAAPCRVLPIVRSLLLAFFVLCALCAAMPAMAADSTLDAALDRLARDDFSETDQAIDEIAASGSERAAQILSALGAARLLVEPESKRVLIQGEDGSLVDARTGAAVSAPAAAAAARVNNRLRRKIDSVMGSLSLTAGDAATRLGAAEALFKARDVEALPALEVALARETDGRVRRAFVEARAAIALARTDASDAERLEAIGILGERGDQDAIGVLRSAELAADLRQVADRAIDRIEEHLSVVEKLQMIWYGLSLGSVLLLAAIGLAITFGVMGVINMAHGEMVMLGAYTTFVVQEAFRTYAPGWFDLSLPLAIPLAFLVAALVGVAIERGVIRFLYGRPLETLLATWGVSLILQQAVRTVFGPTNREVGAPSYMQGAIDVLGLSITLNRLWIIGFTLAVFAALLAILKLTALGLQMRAVTQNRRMAAAMGIRTPRVDAMTFALGSGIAGMAGVALSQIDNVSPNLGQSYIIDSFLVVVFGGVGNLWGTLVSAFTLGVANKFLEPIAGAVLGKILILVLIILFIQKRPRGLFALKGRAVEV